MHAYFLLLFIFVSISIDVSTMNSDGYSVRRYSLTQFVFFLGMIYNVLLKGMPRMVPRRCKESMNIQFNCLIKVTFDVVETSYV